MNARKNDFIKKPIKPTILVADSNPAALAQTVRILSCDEFNIFSSACRASAISAANKLDLDLIVCDLTLWMGTPDDDLIAEIHQIPGREYVPVIFTSTGQGPNVIRRQHEFGGAYHIKKPFDPVVLTELVDKALWLPHLVKSHEKRPHFVVNPAVMNTGLTPLPMVQPPIQSLNAGPWQ